MSRQLIKRPGRQFVVAVPTMLVPVVLLSMAGCASTPPPVADLSRAHTLIAEAERSDAPRYDGGDLAAAQDKMQQADQDAKEKPAVAARLAQEAAVDAELALARTRVNKEQEALNEVNASLSAVRRQTGEGAPESAPAATPPSTNQESAPGTTPQRGPQP